MRPMVAATLCSGLGFAILRGNLTKNVCQGRANVLAYGIPKMTVGAGRAEKPLCYPPLCRKGKPLMPARKHLVLSVAAFCCGLVSLLLFFPAEPWPWVGMGGALAAVILARLAKPQGGRQQVLAMGGVLLALVAGIAYLVLHWPR